MPKTQFFTATTLDGFIADQDHSLSWLFEVAAGDYMTDTFAPFLADVGAMAMGSTTYEWMLAYEMRDDPARWRAAYGDRPCWVFTSRDLPAVPGADLRFVRGDVRPVHEQMTQAAGDRNLWVVGGGELVGKFADAGLLDELQLSVAPVTLGAGAPLLPRRLLSSRLTVSDVRQMGQFVHLTYAVGAPG